MELLPVLSPWLPGTGRQAGRGSPGHSPRAWQELPLGLPLPAQAWSLPITISSTESPFKTHHKSPGSKGVTPGTASPRNLYHSWGGSDAGWDGGTVVQGVPVHGQGSSASRAVPRSALISGADFINSRSVFPGHMLSCIQNTFVRTSIFNAIYAKCCCKKQPLT